MTQLLPVNLPLFSRCLRIPAKWREEKGVLTVHRPNRPLIEEMRSPVYATHFDPWEKRDEFFALKHGDTQALVTFLETVGLFQRASFDIKRHPKIVSSAAIRLPNEEVSYETYYVSTMSTLYVWGIQKLLMRCLIENEVGRSSDFEVRIDRVNGLAQVIFTTLTFIDAVLLTLTIDRVMGAKVRKCARPDCGIPFAYTGGHRKKYHCWNCGHVESVRRQRRRKRRKKRK